jgi:prolyl-tRNA editing enzyme YbaK/EbsC (Cys-tRNA(Pro) deacylase)
MDMEKNLSQSALRVQQELDRFGIALQVVELPQSTRTAQDAAQAVGVQIGQIVKSMIFRSANHSRSVLVLTSGANRVDEGKIERWIGEPIKKAKPDFVREKTGFSIGGVPPLAHKEPVITIVDEDLLPYAEIWAAAGTPNAVFRLTPMELLRMTKSIATDVANRR